MRLSCLWLLLAAACAPPPDEATPPADPVVQRDLVYFLGRLRSVEHLPELEQAHTAMSSTWDRSGGNDDGDDFKGLSGTTNVLLDVDGPGCVHRLYTGFIGEALSGTRLQIMLDHASAPLFDMPVSEFFAAKTAPFPPPLTRVASYSGTHFPIPFAEHCRIQLVNEQGKNWGLYWQATYSRYPRGTPVRSLSWPPSAAERAEIERVVGAWSLATRDGPPEPESWTVDRQLSLLPGQPQRVELPGCGVVQQLRLQLRPLSAEVLQHTWLRIRWDGATAPSVALPVGYLFGHGDAGERVDARFRSLLLGVTAEGAYSRFPMPFARGALLELQYDGASPQVGAQLRLSHTACHSLPPNLGRFHATWHHGPAASASSATFGPQQVPGQVLLHHSGRGKYVGALMHLDWPYPFQWWGEGDWLVWSDESGWPPSYHGTGTEEYVNSGWTLFDRSPVSGFVTVRPGPVGVYSFHLNDAFQFAESIKVVQEQVGSFGGDITLHGEHPDWRTTALWYALPAQPAGSDAL